MKYVGNLLKMRTVANNPVTYYLLLGQNEIVLNDLLNTELIIQYLHEINCIRCGRKTNKSFAQGYCFPCFRVAPETEECVLRPELCRAHEGLARNMDFARDHCLIDHFVYLSCTSGIKVGVTRNTQIPTRWIDQGAVRAIKIAKTPNRYLAGCIEVFLKNHFNDKTNWRVMLSATKDITDFLAARDKALELLMQAYSEYAINNDIVTKIHYPVQTFPEKITSIDLEKTDQIKDTLTGIKGQYLIFKSGRVINIRKHNGYRIEFEY